MIWSARRWVSRLGLPGVAGLGLLAFCGMFYWSAVVPVAGEAQALQSEVRSFQARRPPSLAQLRQLPAGQLSEFYKTFPDEGAVPDVLARLHQAAATHDVSLERGEYNLVRNNADNLVRYEMTLPVKSDYAHIRKFLSEFLAAVPYASLDSVEFERQKIGDAAVEAQIKMTLYLLDKR